MILRYGSLPVDSLVQSGRFQGAQQAKSQGWRPQASNEILFEGETSFDSDGASAGNRHHRRGKGIRKIDGRAIDIIRRMLDAANGKRSIDGSN